MKEFHPHVGLGISAHTAVIEASLMRYACPLPTHFHTSVDDLKETVEAMAVERASVILFVDDSGTMEREAINRAVKNAHRIAAVMGVITSTSFLSGLRMEIDPPEANPFPIMRDMVSYIAKEREVRPPWLGEDHNRTMVKRRVNQSSKKKKRRKR